MGAGCSTTDPTMPAVNPSDAIGQVLNINGGCAPSGTAQNYLGSFVPNNGEYEWAGEGPGCHYCSTQAPRAVGCSSGCASVQCCSIMGSSGTYKRTKYGADPVQCCLQSASMIGNQTCDPQYRVPTSTACYDAIKAYCIQGDNLFSQNVCQSWCSSNPTECQSYKESYCNQNANVSSSYCQTWCMDNMGSCDNSMDWWCAQSANQKDPKCSCINSDLIQYQYNPLCDDKNCIDTGYQTNSMVNARGSGCQIVDCSTYFNVQAGGNVTFDDVNIAQRCGTPTAQAEEKIDNFITWAKSHITVVGPLTILIIGLLLYLIL